MFGLQGPELILILLLVLIVFGAGKLPQVFNQLGKGVKEFREASEGRSEDAQTPTPATGEANHPAADPSATTYTPTSPETAGSAAHSGPNPATIATGAPPTRVAPPGSTAHSGPDTTTPADRQGANR